MDFEFTPVEDLNKVPEQFRSLYADKPGEDGKFSVAESGRGIADAINGFNRTTKTLRQQLKDKSVDLSPLAAYGDNPQSIAEAVAAQIESAGANKNADVNKAVANAKEALQAGFKTELDKAAARNQALQSQLYDRIVVADATAAVAELKGVPELLLPFIKSQVKVVEEDGQLRATVVTDSGEVRYGMTGSPMTIKELVTEMKSQERYGRLFESDNQRGGGGAPPGAGRRTVPNPSDRTERSANDKISAGLANRFPRR